jgi:hypothetical protein
LLRGVQDEDEGGTVEEDEHGRVGHHGAVRVFKVATMLSDVSDRRWAWWSPESALLIAAGPITALR